MNILFRYDFLCYIDEYLSSSPEKIQILGETKLMTNPDHKLYLRKDHLIAI